MTAAIAPQSTAVLELHDIVAGYGEGDVLRGVTLAVNKGAIVTLLGANGAGKTTLLRIASGILKAKSGHVMIGLTDLTERSAQARAKAGICLIPEGRGIFRSLSVRDNLELFRPTWAEKSSVESIVEIFPVLGGRLNQTAGTLSGGEQQMLALSRAFLSEASVVLVDEVSMGLAPKLVDQVFEILARISAEGVSVLLVEQYVSRALEIADYAYVLSRGQIVLSGTTDQIDPSDVAGTYLA
jgi:branched-chain amino acid transport system ATP-binding protein